MPTPDWREGDVLTALLDQRAGLNDPMKVAAALDELQGGTRKAPGSLHERVHAMLEPKADEAPRPARRLRRPPAAGPAAGGAPGGRGRAAPARLLRAVGLGGAAAVLALGVVSAAGTGTRGDEPIVDAGRAPATVTEATGGIDPAPAPPLAQPPSSGPGSAPLGATQVPIARDRLQRYQLWMQLQVGDKNHL